MCFAVQILPKRPQERPGFSSWLSVFVGKQWKMLSGLQGWVEKQGTWQGEVGAPCWLQKWVGLDDQQTLHEALPEGAFV